MIKVIIVPNDLTEVTIPDIPLIEPDFKIEAAPDRAEIKYYTSRVDPETREFPSIILPLSGYTVFPVYSDKYDAELYADLTSYIQ